MQKDFLFWSIVTQGRCFWRVVTWHQHRHAICAEPMTFWGKTGALVHILHAWRLRLRLHGTGPEPFRTEPDQIGFCSHGTVWNRSRCLHGIFLEPVRIGSDTGPAKQQVQFWILSGPVPERSCVNRRPIRSKNRTGSVPDRSRVNIALVEQKWRNVLVTQNTLKYWLSGLFFSYVF